MTVKKLNLNDLIGKTIVDITDVFSGSTEATINFSDGTYLEISKLYGRDDEDEYVDFDFNLYG